MFSFDGEQQTPHHLPENGAYIMNYAELIRVTRKQALPTGVVVNASHYTVCPQGVESAIAAMKEQFAGHDAVVEVVGKVYPPQIPMA